MNDPIQPLDPEQVQQAEKSAQNEGYVQRELVALDTFANVTADGLPDETISSRMARWDTEDTGLKHEAGKIVSEGLDLFQKNHGAKAEAGDLGRAEEVEKTETSTKTIPGNKMACPAMKFNGVTPAHFVAIADEVKKETGMELSGDSGTTSEHGFTVTWDYNPETQDLILQCTEKPWIVPASMVQSKITELVHGHIGV